MKTEKEFLEGIYQKAAAQQEMTEVPFTSKKGTGFHKRKWLVAAAMFCLLLPLGRSVWQERDASLEKEESLQRRIAPSSYQEEVESTNILEAMVVEKWKDEDQIYLRIRPVTNFLGEIEEEILVVCELQDTAVLEKISADEMALFYCIKEGESYRLSEEENGICSYLKTEDGSRVYVNQDGKKIDTKELLKK